MEYVANKDIIAKRIARIFKTGDVVNLGIGLITPPVGSVLFVGSAIANLTIEQVTKAMLPFYVGLFAVLMGVTYIPEISLWLPGLVGLH